MKRYLFDAALVIAWLLVLSVYLRANTPVTITINGTGAVVQVSTTDQQASSIQFTAPAANSGIARVGDVTTSSTVGEALPAGSGQYFAPKLGGYSLNQFWVYVANGDKLTIVWVKE